MRLRHIEVFHAVYSTGSVSRAARLLNVSQPSVSKVLRHAEDGLGYALFERVKGRVVPTAEAHALYEEVKGIHEQLQSLERRANNLRSGRTGHVRVMVMPALGLDLLPMAVAQFRGENPDVSFDIGTAHFVDIVTAIREQKCDLAIAFNPPQLAGLTRHTIGGGRMLCAHGPGLFNGQAAVTLGELAAYPLVGIKDSGPLSQLVTAQAQAEGVTLDAAVTVQTYYIARNLVRYGAGVAVVDHLTALAHAGDGVEYRPLSPQLRYEVVGLSDEAGPLPRVAENFLHFFRRIYVEKANA
jgi:DNA-binding transcriptional LysR family regulator